MFFPKIKNHCLVIIALLFSFGMQTKLSASTEARYKAMLQAEEKQLLGNLIAVFGITFAEWESFKSTYESSNYSSYENHEIQSIQERCKESVSELLKQKILSIIAQSPIRRPITIIRDRSPHGHDIFALQNTLVVDEERFNHNYAQDHQVHAIIWHEIMHILHEDDLIMRCLSVLRHTAINTSDHTGWLRTWGEKVKAHYSEEKWKRALVPWCMFRERRADLLSGLANQSNAQAL